MKCQLGNCSNLDIAQKHINMQMIIHLCFIAKDMMFLWIQVGTVIWLAIDIEIILYQH